MLISIVVSIYNGANTLEKCLESLVLQTRKDYEIILIDDGSIDNSGSICDDYAKKYSFVSVIHQKNSGLSAARRTGYHAANGDYLMFLDCDDYVSIDLIKILGGEIDRKQPDLLLYDYCLVKMDGEVSLRKLNVPLELEERYKPDLFAVNSISSGWNQSREPYLVGFVWTRCIKREILSDDVFISERKCYTEDVLFNIAISHHVKSMIYIQQPLYYYCVVENSLTNRYRENMWEMLIFRQHWIISYCKKYQLMDKAKERLDRSWWSAIMMSFDNICLLDSYSDVKKKMQLIRNSIEYKNEIGNVIRNRKLVSRMEKIKYFLIKNKLYYIYFLLKKMDKIKQVFTYKFTFFD